MNRSSWYLLAQEEITWEGDTAEFPSFFFKVEETAVTIWMEG